MAMVDGDGAGGWRWISAASGRGCCADGSLFGDFCCESYMGAFTEVACFEETKAVAPGTGGRYGRVAGAPPVPCHPGLKLFSFAIPLTWCRLATRKSAFNAQISLLEVSITARKT